MREVKAIDPHKRIFVPITPKQFPTICFIKDKTNDKIIKTTPLEEELSFIEIRRFGKL